MQGYARRSPDTRTARPALGLDAPLGHNVVTAHEALGHVHATASAGSPLGEGQRYAR